MKFDEIPKGGTTQTRKAFWDKVMSAIESSQKKAGKNVSVDVHDGYGTVINAIPQGKGASSCPSITTVTFDSVLLDCGCVPRSIWTDIDLNRSFSPLVLVASDPTFCRWEYTTTDPIVHADDYNDDSCTDLFGSRDLGIHIIVFYEFASGYTVIVELDDNTRIAFVNNSASFALPLSNDCTCNGSFFGLVGMAHSGTANIT